MKKIPTLLILSFCLLLTFSSRASAVVIIANTADDVCAPTADPCQIVDEVQVQDFATLDFGTREILLTGGGQLNFGFAQADLLAGNITLSPSNGAAINLKDSFFGDTVGGFVAIVARRACSGDAARPCTSDFECAALGVGACSAGPAGTFTLNGRLAGNANEPGSITIFSTGTLTIAGNINISGDTPDSDGGIVELDSSQGSVLLNNPITATSGTQSTGGEVIIAAALDITTNAVIDVSSPGGDSEGGVIEFDAGRDLHVNDDLLANGGADFGGSILGGAGRDLLIQGGTSSNAQRIEVDGGSNSFNEAGDAGDIEFSALNDIVIGPNARLDGRGAAPDGDGSFGLTLDASRDVIISGRLDARAVGGDGFGGNIDVAASGAISVTPSGLLDARGGSGGAGIIDLTSGGPMNFQGTISGTANNQGDGAFVSLDSSAEARISGAIDVSGTPTSTKNGEIAVTACQVVIATGGSLVANGGRGENILTGRERITVEAGATLNALGGIGSVNTIRYRDPNKPPTLLGTISPAPSLSLAILIGCPVCGNGEVEQTESCDDGNLVNGDQCSAECQDEGCVAETPGFPGVSLCNDGVGCTLDTCNAATHSCEHVFSCDDGIACTNDLCVGEQCQNTPDDSLCSDGNVCTDDICSGTTGCQFVSVPGPCDDGESCTINDQCSGGFCSGDAQNCMICGDGVLDNGELCDHNGNNGVTGDNCGTDCTFSTCGDPNGTAIVTASDALFILQAAVGAASCDVCLCDVLQSGGAAITASDAAAALRFSVGVPITLNCPPCQP